MKTEKVELTTYRTAPPKPEEHPHVFEYLPEKERASSSVEAWFNLAAPILLAAGVLTLLPSWAMPFGVGAAVALWWWQRRRAMKPHMTLVVAGGELTVKDARDQTVLECSLEELDDVMLDTRTIERVQETPGALAELRFINSTVGPAIDESRIVLITAHDELHLTERYTSSIDATDWYSKLRKFLRAHGWIPLLDRPE